MHHRMRAQQSAKLLKQFQDDIRFHIRQSNERAKKAGSAEEQDAYSIWKMKPVLYLFGEPITALPKKRSFWLKANFNRLSTLQLRAVADLLDMDSTGRKQDVIARLQDWVNMPQLEKQRKIIAQENIQAEKLEASGSVFAFGNNAVGQLGLGNRESQTKPIEIRALKGKKIIKVFTVSICMNASIHSIE